MKPNARTLRTFPYASTTCEGFLEVVGTKVSPPSTGNIFSMDTSRTIHGWYSPSPRFRAMTTQHLPPVIEACRPSGSLAVDPTTSAEERWQQAEPGNDIRNLGKVGAPTPSSVCSIRWI